jgi:hypothetical protein
MPIIGLKLKLSTLLKILVPQLILSLKDSTSKDTVKVDNGKVVIKTDVKPPVS